MGLVTATKARCLESDKDTHIINILLAKLIDLVLGQRLLGGILVAAFILLLQEILSEIVLHMQMLSLRSDRCAARIERWGCICTPYLPQSEWILWHAFQRVPLPVPALAAALASLPPASLPAVARRSHASATLWDSPWPVVHLPAPASLYAPVPDRFSSPDSASSAAPAAESADATARGVHLVALPAPSVASATAAATRSAAAVDDARVRAARAGTASRSWHCWAHPSRC